MQQAKNVTIKLTKWHLNPVNFVCLILLSIVTVTVLTANKPATVKPSSVAIGRQDDEYYDTHPLTWKDMKEYQLEIVNEKYVILFYYNKVVAVIPLDKNCNLTNAIKKDSQ